MKIMFSFEFISFFKKTEYTKNYSTMTIQRISNTTICSIFLTYKNYHCNIFYWGRPKRGIYAVSYGGHTRCKPMDWLLARLQRPTRAI